MSYRKSIAVILLAVFTAAAETFTNPLLPNAPDPWVIVKDGFYYQMNSTGRNLTIRKTADITDLRHAETKVVWTPPPSGPYSQQIWAPELHFLDGAWYIYFAADSGSNETHRLWVIQNTSADPLSGNWVFKGQLAGPTNKWAIDATVFEDRGKLYALWSGWEGDKNGVQNLYIAALKNPWTIAGNRVKLSSPTFAWERHGSQKPPFVAVNEGPEILKHQDSIFLVYSASGCWTDFYSLGMLAAHTGSDLLSPASWKKSPEPVFSGSSQTHAYSPGHNGFFRPPGSTQDWIIYHANSEPGQGCDDHRSPRIQPFTWNSDGTPHFGDPRPLGEPLAKP